MKNLIILILILITNFAYGQVSYSYQFAFKLYDNGKPVDFKTFCEEYKYVNVYGDILDICDKNSNKTDIGYNAKDSIFYVHISSIVHNFSFALHHNNQVMTFFFPFEKRTPNYYYVDSLEFKKGNFYFDFRTEKLSKANDIAYGQFYKLKDINYEQLEKAFNESEYLGREKIFQSFEIKE